MVRAVQLTPESQDALALLGNRLRLGRLRRNLSQEELAERAGIGRKAIIALEAGAPGATLAVLVKVLAILGYPERVADLMAADPLGEEMEAVTGRKRAGGRADVADF